VSVTSRIIATSQNNIHYYIEDVETMQPFFKITQKESEALSRLRDDGPASRFRLQYIVTRSSTLLLYLTGLAVIIFGLLLQHRRLLYVRLHE